MIDPQPIRYGQDTWLVMRNNKVLPKAVIQRVHHREGDRYLVFRWDLDPRKRELMSVVGSLEGANDLVRYDPVPTGVTPFAAYPDTRSPAQRLRDEDKRLPAEHERSH